MTSTKRSNVQTKPNQTNQHIMADDFRISELVTLAPGFVRAAIRAAARGLFFIYSISF